MVNQLTFPRELRLLTPEDFQNVFQHAVRLSSPHLTLVVTKNSLTYPRIGFAIAKKQIKRAHERNRIKRIVRNEFRLKQHMLPAVDVVVMARTSIVELSNAEIRIMLDKLWARLLKNNYLH